MTAESFAQRLARGIQEVGPLVLGIDPHPGLLTQLGFDDSAFGAAAFFNQVLSDTAGQVAFYKPQIALFEQYGTTGLIEYARVLESNRLLLRETGSVIIADAKRADIGTSMTGYTRAWLSDDSDLSADALTVNPYLGLETLKQFFETAISSGRGAFVLALNSNPESFALQKKGQPSLASCVLHELRKTLSGLTRHQGGRSSSITPNTNDAPFQQDSFEKKVQSWSDIGVVVGATVQPADYGLTAEDFIDLPILMPGVGAQGGTIDQVLTHFGPVSHQLLINQSRSLFREGMSGLSQIVQTENTLLHRLLVDKF